MPSKPRSFHIADLFCGAGGTSTGAMEAIAASGMSPVLTAVNHWPTAIETHTANHPASRHLCTGIDSINPRDLYAENQLDLLWASPECTHHSIARGGRPINDQSRATAWCVIRWAEALRPPFILIENVPEFLTWGPIGTNGKPLASRRGETFRAWLAALQSLGYRTSHRIICAADFGDPTTRTRLFVQAVRGRRKICWPQPTHAKHPAHPAVRPWRPAREIIDWSLPSCSIYSRRKPLSEKTMSRIMAGLRKFGMAGFIVPNFGEAPGQQPRVHSLDQPLPTVTSHGAGCLVSPFIVSWDHTSGGEGTGVSSIEEPLTTIVTKARHGIAEPFLIELRGTAPDSIMRTSRNLDEPLPTVTASGNHHALVEPFLIKTAHGAGRGGDANRVKSIDEPMPTVCGNRGDMALIEPFLVNMKGMSDAASLTMPCPTVTAHAPHLYLAEPFIVHYYGTGVPSSVDQPLSTVTTKERHGLAMPIIERNGERYRLDIRFRMLQPHELALAQGFHPTYRFAGTKTDQVRQIGNAVPRRLARALVAALVSQNPDVSHLAQADDSSAA